MVHSETAATSHTPIAVSESEVVTFNIVSGELLYLDEKGNVAATENCAHRDAPLP